MWRYFLIATAFLIPVFPQGGPSTDIYLVELGPPLQVRNLTERAGYDNQPAFLPGENAFLYSSQRSDQSDIYRYDLDRGSSSRLTKTEESEYSATLLPGGDRFSVIRVEKDGRQRLWSFRLDGTDPQLLVAGLEPVGYQAWPSPDRVVTFVLGSPATLQLAGPNSAETEILARQIGRCLRLVPGQSAVSYVSKAETPWMIRKWHAASGIIEDVAPVLEGSEDHAWAADGGLFMGLDDSLFAYSFQERRWQRQANLSAAGVAGVTRLDVSSNGRRFLVVARSNQGSRQR